jgi:hypothetical protein
MRWHRAFFCAALLLAIVGEAQFAFAQSTPVTNGYRDFHFGVASSNEPTYGKSESKLWWNDGSWWGLLWNPLTNQYEIYRLETATQTWVSTNTAADIRSGSRADVLWDGQRLYIASHYYASNPGPTTPNFVSKLYRYSYNAAAKQYTPDAPPGGVNINNSKSKTLTLDKDSTGKLWITWMEGNKIYLNRSLGNDLTWGTPFVLPVQATPGGGNDTDPDDISALVAFGGNKIGVMWSNQKDSTNYFAVHRDGDPDEVWQPAEIALSGAGLGPAADDHFILKASCDPASRDNLYAATVTNLSGAQAASIFVLKRNAAGIWSRHVFATENLNHTRPTLVVDDENQRLYVFARSTDTNRGNIYMKSAGLGDLIFPTGRGTPILRSASDINITNPTATKQCVNNATGILILAADKDSRYYLHNHIDLINRRPRITAFAPANAPINSLVTITGNNFTGASKVLFNSATGGTLANFTFDADTQIRAVVPIDATNGKITIINDFGAGTSATDFFVTLPPSITSFTPLHGPVGTLVTIIGNNFNAMTSVAFNGLNAPGFTVDSNTQIRASVPTGATTGKISVANAEGIGVSQNNFTVTLPPLIFSFAPVRGVAGTEITITGNFFDGATNVSFNGIPATFVLDSNTQLRAKVPAGATTGLISITNSAGTGVSLANFIAQYTLTISVTGSGRVDLIPPGGTAGAVYDAGALVSLNAVPLPGSEFRNWDGDLRGANPAMTLMMDADKKVTAKFQDIGRYTVTLNITGAGNVTLDPPPTGGIYFAGTVVTLTARPETGHVFSGYTGDFKGWMNVETISIDANKNLTAIFSPLPVPRNGASQGIWTSAAEIAGLPMSGLSWNELKAGADEPIGLPNLSDLEDSVNVHVLAKALVYARTGEESYRDAVIASCMAAIGTEEDGETLALGRELLAYVLAADLVRLPEKEDEKFRKWLRKLLTENFEGQSLRSAHETRPNNWGLHSGATRAAIARYLGDVTELERTARVFKGWLGDRTTYADFTFNPEDLSWQADPNAPVGINPAGATIQGRPVDGVLPDDQRRAGPFRWPPPKENYVYGALQGALMQAIILYRAGYDVWNWQDQALRRAMQWLYNQANYPAEGDDKWLPHIVNYFYKASFPAPFPAGAGKNAGWTDWLYGSKYALTARSNNGDIVIHSVGMTSDSLHVLSLMAQPQSGYLFTAWGGDLSGVKNPETLIMNAHKNVSANFVKAGPFNVAVSIVGPGAVTLDPPGGVYNGGTVLKLTATANPGFKFTGWSGDLTPQGGTTNPLSLTITSHMNITATFKAIYDLTVEVIGRGKVMLDPAAGPYEAEVVVTVTAIPDTGYQFVEWRGDLAPQGAANPATLTMNAAKRVQAVFTVIRVSHEETKTGGATSSALLATAANLTGVKDHLYLAAITTRPRTKVNSVTGLGLKWTLVKAQCSGRGNIGIELWMAQGAPASVGIVNANLASAPYNSAIVVSRYAGVSTTHPIDDVVSGNTKGLDGPCDGGLDNTSYSFNVATAANGAVVYGVAGMRNKTHAPGIGYLERVEMKQGSSSSTASIVVQDKVFPAAGAATVNGTFNGNTDWAMLAVAIRPQASGDPGDFEDPDGKPSLPFSLQLHPNYPNPFSANGTFGNLGTNIEFFVSIETNVRLEIYNLRGQRVRTLVNGVQSAGRNVVQWNGTDDTDAPVSAGIYLLQLQAGAERLTRRIILLK